MENVKKSIKGTKTEQNLLKAFAGESQAMNRYTFFAKIAKKEGYEQINQIFIETAANEKYHAKLFYSFLEGGEVEITSMFPAGIIGTTVENLRAAAEGEHEEWTSLYLKFAEIAREEGFNNIAVKFKLVASIEEEHEKRFLKLLDNIENNKVFKKMKLKNGIAENAVTSMRVLQPLSFVLVAPIHRLISNFLLITTNFKALVFI